MQKNPTPVPRLLVVVAAALFDRDGNVLVAQRRADQEHPGLWEFPGGKVEAGETAESALARELQEELGITVDPALLQPAAFTTAERGERQLLLLLFTCRRWTGEPRPHAAAALEWIAAGDWTAVPLIEADLRLAKMLTL